MVYKRKTVTTEQPNARPVVEGLRVQFTLPKAHGDALRMRAEVKGKTADEYAQRIVELALASYI